MSLYWVDGTVTDAEMVEQFLVKAKYSYESPTSPGVRNALNIGQSELHYRNTDLDGILIIGKPSQPVLNLEVCAASSSELDWVTGLATLERRAAASGVHWLMVIEPPGWMLRFLLGSYEYVDNVVFYSRGNEPISTMPALPPGIRIEAVQETDIPQIVQVDAASFIPLWQGDSETLQRWLADSKYAYTLRVGNQVIAYIMAGARNAQGHIYRIAVTPGWQGRGLGKWLTLRVIKQLLALDVQDISLNTQASNHISRKLYESLGFKLTGLSIPIYAKQLSG